MSQKKLLVAVILAIAFATGVSVSPQLAESLVSILVPSASASMIRSCNGPILDCTPIFCRGRSFAPCECQTVVAALRPASSHFRDDRFVTEEVSSMNAPSGALL